MHTRAQACVLSKEAAPTEPGGKKEVGVFLERRPVGLEHSVLE